MGEPDKNMSDLGVLLVYLCSNRSNINPKIPQLPNSEFFEGSKFRSFRNHKNYLFSLVKNVFVVCITYYGKPYLVR